MDAIVLDSGFQTSVGALCGEIKTRNVFALGVMDGTFMLLRSFASDQIPSQLPRMRVVAYPFICLY